MDEVLFRSSRKLEHLQLQYELAHEHGKAALHNFSNQTKSTVIRIWNSSLPMHLQETIKQAAKNILEIISNVKQGVVTNTSRAYRNIITIIGFRWTRQNLYFGCVGFILGGLIGFGIGVAIYKRQAIIRYMQAVQCIRYSGIEAVAVIEDAVAPHDCDLNDVIVDVKAASIHVIDAQICNGYGRKIRWLMNRYKGIAKHDLPVTLGRDCTGIIMDIGKKVSRLEVGDEVWLTVPFWAPGTLSQTVLVDESKVARKPKNIGYEAASSLPYAGTIALSALNQSNVTASNSEARRILIQDGCTPVGCILIQILNLWKAHITTTCFKRAVPVAHALGAHDVICLPEREMKDSELAEKTDGDDNEMNVLKLLTKEFETRNKFDVIIITGNHGLSIEEYRLYCNTNGQIVSTLPPMINSDSFGYTLSCLFGIFIRIKFLVRSLLGGEMNYFGETHMCFISLDRIKNLVESGHLQTVVDKVYHPSEIELALSHIQSSHSIGSTIISFR